MSASTGTDFSAQLSKQLRFIETSCREYDSGNEDEGIRIAAAIRVILHDTNSSISLLTHLNANSVNLLSTAGDRNKNNPKGFWPALIQIKWDLENNVLSSVPTFDSRRSAHSYVSSKYWWNDEIVFYSAGKQYTRKLLVLHATNKDGGAHVDKSFPDDYQWLINGADFSTGVKHPDGREFINNLPNPHLAYLRQMGYELLRSPSLLELAKKQKSQNKEDHT